MTSWASHWPGQHQWPLPHGGEHQEVENGVSVAGDSPGQHLTQVGLSREEINLVLSSPYHAVCQSRSTGMQVTVSSQATLDTEPWIHHEIWAFSLTRMSSEPCMGEAGQQRVRGYLHAKEHPRKPPSHSLKMVNSYSLSWKLGPVTCRHRSTLVWEGKQLFPAWREKVHTVLCFVFSREQSCSDCSQAFSAVCQSPAFFMHYIRSPSTSLRCFQLLSAAI